MAMGLLPPVVATLVADIHQFSAEMDKAKAQMSAVGASGSSAMSKLGAGVAVAGVGIAAASVKMASDFETQMTRLYTAAGAPKAAVQAATDQVLALGNSVGYSGTQIAEALYHPVSAGLDLATSLQVVKYAAQEAQISGASLDDTTYSLSSVMKAFNEPASEAGNTMAQLNAIVGQGDMHFQDFNTSIKNWAPTAAQMGISIDSMGAALAYLTDRGNSAEEAATRVTMGLSMMATPSKQAASLLEGMGVASSDVAASTDAMTTVLKKTGITQNELAADLQKPDGIYVALTHLKDALDAAGVHGTEADSVLSKIFGGGRSDKAILSLMQNLDGLQTKFGDITGATGQFGQAWAATQDTFAFKLKQTGAEAENVAIKFGTILIPVIETVIGWFDRNKWAVDVLAGVIGVTLVTALVKFSITATTTFLEAIGKVITAVTGMGTAATTTATETEAASVATGGWAASLGKALPIIGLVVAGAGMLGEKLGQISGVGDHTAVDVNQMSDALMQAANGSKQAQDQLDGFVRTMNLAGSTLHESTQGMQGIDQALTQLYTSGNVGAAKTEFDALTKALETSGLSASDAASRFPGYTKAVSDAAEQQKLAAAAAGQAGSAVGGTVDPLNQAAGAAQGGADAVNALSDAFTALSGNITSSTALDTFHKDLLQATDDVKKNGDSLKDDTLAGLANRDAFRNAADEILKYRDAQIKNKVSTDDANQTAAQQVKQLIDVWDQLTGNKTQVESYAKELGLLDLPVNTQVNVDVSGALNNLNKVITVINQIGSTNFATLPGSGGRSRGPVAYALGGWVDAPKGQAVPAILHGGEFVLSTDMLAGIAGGDAGFQSMPSLGSPGGTGGGGASVVVEVYLDGKRIQPANQRATLRYQRRNSRNGLSLSGIGG